MHIARTLIPALVMALIPTTASAEEGVLDPLDQLQEIRDTFRRGSYESVVGSTEVLLESGPSMLVRAEALQYRGASLELLGRTEEAEDAFETLVNLQPEWAINRSEFPTEVIGLFDSVRDRVEDQLNRIDEQRRRAQAVQQRERERQLAERHQRLLELSRPRYMVRANESHLVVALLPFGAGQFQNGQREKGFAFFGSQIGFTAISMTLWLLGSIPNLDFEAGTRQGLTYASYGVYGALVVSVLWGIVDGVVNFLRLRRRQSTWTEVPESDVPEESRVNFEETLTELENTSNR